MILNKIKALLKNKSFIMYASFVLIFLVMIIIGISKAKPSGQSGDGIYDYNAISIGNLEVRWYAIFIMTGIVFAYVMAKMELKKFNISVDTLYDGLLIFVPAAIIGGRLWYILFNLDQVNSFIDIFAVWDGGLAIHGAIITTFIGLIWFAKWKKISYWLILDIVAVGFLIGQIMGRWGNFFNHELYGPAVADGSFLHYILPSFIKNQVMVGGVLHHPTFLYESLLNLVGLIFLLVIRRKKVFKLGDMLAFYLVWYGIVRIPNEILRLNSGVSEPLMLAGMSASILTSVGLIIAGVAVFILKRYFAKELPYYAQVGQKAVLFDLDGTLLDTEALIIRTFKQVFAEKYPKLNVTEEAYLSFIGPTLEESFSKYEKNNKKVIELVELYRKYNRLYHKAGVKVFPHAKETIEALKEKGYYVGVVSSKKREFVALGLHQNNLLDAMDVLVCSDDVDVHKPNPTSLLKALSEIGVLPEFAYYVGDHENDIKAAKNARVTSIAVSYSPHYDKLLKENPDYVIDDLIKVLEII